MTGPATLTAVLASHNRKNKTLACLAALHACERSVDLRVIHYDDGSMDGTADAVRARFPQVRIIAGQGDAYWAGGMRAAFAAALAEESDYVLWLNDDVCLKPDALSRLLSTYADLLAAGRDLAIVGGAVADAESGRTSYAGVVRPSSLWPLRFRTKEPHPTACVRCDTLVGNVVLVPRITAKTIGGIDAAYRHTLADLDYGLRVSSAGGRCVLAPGHVGWCEPNRRRDRWFNPDLPVLARWRLLGHPLGFPLRPWLHFARRHGGPAWFLFAPLPFWRLLVPVRLARCIGRRRNRPRAPEASHA